MGEWSMSLQKSWVKAKNVYDGDAKIAAKKVATLEKQFDAVTKKAAKEHKKLKLPKKLKEYLDDPTLARIDHARQLIPFLDDVKKKQHEIHSFNAPRPRKRIGAEPAFAEVDKVVEVGRKLVAAGVEDGKKWQKWMDMAKKSLVGCAKAEKKFEAWMPNTHNDAEENFEFEFRKIHAKMKDMGTPLLRHAQKCVQDA